MNLSNIPSTRDTSSLERQVAAWFLENGWSTKKSKARRKQNSYISRKKKHHTKIVWEISSATMSWANRGIRWTCVDLYVKTANGGWTASQNNSGKDLALLVAEAEAIPAPILITKETLPKACLLGNVESFSFIERAAYVHQAYGSFRTNSQLKMARVVGVVGLEKDGTVSPKEIYKPGETAWFHLALSSHEGAYCDVITDGEIMHPINMRGKRGSKKRVTSNVPDMLKNTTTEDKLLVHKAIGMVFSDKEKEV